MTSASLPDVAETSRWYEGKVRRYGFDHRGLGFRNRSSQEKRFEANKPAWIERLRAARDELDRARVREVRAKVVYGNERRNRHARGEAKEAFVKERDDAERAARDAELALDTLLEQARRAGVPPGWVREAIGEDSPPAGPQP